MNKSCFSYSSFMVKKGDDLFHNNKDIEGSRTMLVEMTGTAPVSQKASAARVLS